MTLRRALSVTTAAAATAPIAPPRAILPGPFPTSLGCACCVVSRKLTPHIGPEPRAAGQPTQGHSRTSCRDWSLSRPRFPFVAARCVDSSSAAKFRVGSGVTLLTGDDNATRHQVLLHYARPFPCQLLASVLVKAGIKAPLRAVCQRCRLDMPRAHKQIRNNRTISVKGETAALLRAESKRRGVPVRLLIDEYTRDIK